MEWMEWNGMDWMNGLNNGMNEWMNGMKWNDGLMNGMND